MAGVYVNDEGTWKLPKSVWINQLGTWRVCKNVYVNKSGAWREMIKTVDLTSSQQNFDLYKHVGSPDQPLSLIFNIESNVTISSYDVLPPYYNGVARFNIAPRTNAFTVGNFPSGSTVIINNNGYISGGGGFGGSGANKISNSINYPNITAAKGGDASHGITKGSSNNFDITIVNTGTIASGGGGGGGAGSYYTPGSSPFSTGGNSGGGSGGDGGGVTGFSRTQGGPGSANNDNYVLGTDGGNGGSLGENGQAGQANGAGQRPNGAGGKAGKAVGSDIELAVSGTIIGTIG